MGDVMWVSRTGPPRFPARPCLLQGVPADDTPHSDAPSGAFRLTPPESIHTLVNK